MTFCAFSLIFFCSFDSRTRCFSLSLSFSSLASTSFFISARCFSIAFFPNSLSTSHRLSFPTIHVLDVEHALLLLDRIALLVEANRFRRHRSLQFTSSLSPTVSRRRRFSLVYVSLLSLSYRQRGQLRLVDRQRRLARRHQQLVVALALALRTRLLLRALLLLDLLPQLLQRVRLLALLLLSLSPPLLPHLLQINLRHHAQPQTLREALQRQLLHVEHLLVPRQRHAPHVRAESSHRQRV